MSAQGAGRRPISKDVLKAINHRDYDTSATEYLHKHGRYYEGTPPACDPPYYLWNRCDCLGFDPGTKHFGWAAVSGHHRLVLANGLFKHPLSSLKKNEAAKSMLLFNAETRALFDEWRPECIAIERFLPRPGANISITEPINIAVGTLSSMFPFGYKGVEHPATYMPTPAQWKAAYEANSVVALEDTYKTCRVTPHQLDASLLALYGAAEERGEEPFVNLRRKSEWIDLIECVEETSKEKLINRKVKRAL